MDQITGIVIPVFGLIGIGFLVSWSGLLKERTGDGLSDFVFTVAIPVLIFRVVATADFSGGSPWFLWLAYYVGYTVAWIAATILVRRLFGRDARTGVVAGVSASYGNTLLIGIPLVITAYGHDGTAAISLLIAVHLPIMMTASAILIERALVADGLSPDADGPAIARSLTRNLAKNPIIIGLFAGIAWRLTGLPIVGPAETVIGNLGDVAATLALVSVGISLRNYGVSGHVAPVLVVALIKLVVMPAIVLAMVLWVLPLPPLWAKAIVIAAACPTGVNAFLVATRFGTSQALASASITLTTGIAVVTVAAWLTIVDWLV